MNESTDNIKKIVIQVDIHNNKTVVSQATDPWMDMALVMEGLAVVIGQAAKYKEMPIREVIAYAKGYLENAALGVETSLESLD